MNRFRLCDEGFPEDESLLAVQDESLLAVQPEDQLDSALALLRYCRSQKSCPFFMCIPEALWKMDNLYLFLILDLWRKNSLFLIWIHGKQLEKTIYNTEKNLMHVSYINGSLIHNFCSNLLYKMSNYFLDGRYVLNLTFVDVNECLITATKLPGSGHTCTMLSDLPLILVLYVHMNRNILSNIVHVT